MVANPHERYELPPRALFASAASTATFGIRAVHLGDVLNSPELVADARPLLVGLGINEVQRPVALDLGQAPHVLISGATGSGKSMSVHAMLVSMLARTQPDRVRFALIDTRALELPRYDAAPHMLLPTVQDPAGAVSLLETAAREVESRCAILATARVRHVDQFNEAAALARPSSPGSARTLSYVLLFVDDVADLIRSRHRDRVLTALATITSLGRIAGVHAIVVTQYPGPTVIPHRLAANIPCRLALGSTDAATSWHALGKMDAQRLPVGGASLRSSEAAKPQSLRGALVSELEIGAVVAHCALQVRGAGSSAHETADAGPPQ